MPIRQYKVFIEHANGRAPARFTVPAGVTQVEAARDAGFQPIKSVSMLNKASGTCTPRAPKGGPKGPLRIVAPKLALFRLHFPALHRR
jgi:hypothetical protein